MEIKNLINSFIIKMLNIDYNKNNTNKNVILNIILCTILSSLLVKNISAQSYDCTNVKCPPLSDISCPEDSFIRDESNFIAEPKEHELTEEIFVHCCVTQQCQCRTCYIPSCENSSFVLMEKEPETKIPGKCCGKYQCIFKPNCTDILNTNGRWFADCQKCKCVNGAQICHRDCDESIISLPMKKCYSNNLNRVFENGDSWKDDECTHCECISGEIKCQTSFCRQLQCNVIIKNPGECCPKCDESSKTDEAKADFELDSTTQMNSDDALIDNTEAPMSTILNTTQSPIVNSTSAIETDFSHRNTTTSKSITDESSSSTTSTTSAPYINTTSTEKTATYVSSVPQQSNTTKTITTTTEASKTPLVIPPCLTKAPNTITYTVPNNSEVISTLHTGPGHTMCYVIMAVLSFCLLSAIVLLYYCEKVKKRSYRPVSATDDNFNKIPIKIKKTDYA